MYNPRSDSRKVEHGYTAGAEIEHRTRLHGFVIYPRQRDTRGSIVVND
jgi:hypothetical protein